jgi:hypothetical protein
MAVDKEPDNKPTWQDFFELMETIDVPDDFLTDRGDVPPQKRDINKVLKG